MNFKSCLILILVLGVVFTAASPFSAYIPIRGKNEISCSSIGTCIYEHATCPSKIVRRDAYGCYFRRKCCMTDFFK